MRTGFAVYESYGSLPAMSSEQRKRTCWEVSTIGTKALSGRQQQALYSFLMLANCLPRARPRCWNTKPIRERKQGLSSDSQPQAEWQKGRLHLHRRWKRWGSVFWKLETSVCKEHPCYFGTNHSEWLLGKFQVWKWLLIHRSFWVYISTWRRELHVLINSI